MSEDIQFYCARLLEIETELSELLPTLEDDRGSRFRITVAVSFLKHARQALSEPLTRAVAQGQ